MERPRTPDGADEDRTSVLDERPTPRRNRRPRFARDESAATTALPGDEDWTTPLPHEQDDWRAERQPPRQLVLDRYRLERRIGAGGFGVVWLAFDEKLEREVAVKVIPRDDDGSDPGMERAEREARVAARLNHPGIVAMYELAADDEAVYLVSE